MDDLIGVDGQDEFTVYSAPAGKVWRALHIGTTVTLGHLQTTMGARRSEISSGTMKQTCRTHFTAISYLVHSAKLQQTGSAKENTPFLSCSPAEKRGSWETSPFCCVNGRSPPIWVWNDFDS